MTSEDVRSLLYREPFTPFRLHLVSGRSVDVPTANSGYMLQNAVMVLQDSRQSGDPGYNVVALRNIEMLEVLSISPEARDDAR